MITPNSIEFALSRGAVVKDCQNHTLTIEDGKIRYKTLEYPWEEEDIEEYQPYTFDGLSWPAWRDSQNSDEIELKLREASPESFIINCETKSEARVVEGVLRNLGLTGKIGKSPKALFVQYDGKYDGLKAKVRGNGIASTDVNTWMAKAKHIASHAWPKVGDCYYTIAQTSSLDKFESKMSKVLDASDIPWIRDSRMAFRGEDAARAFASRLNSVLFVGSNSFAPSM